MKLDATPRRIPKHIAHVLCQILDLAWLQIGFNNSLAASRTVTYRYYQVFHQLLRDHLADVGPFLRQKSYGYPIYYHI